MDTARHISRTGAMVLLAAAIVAAPCALARALEGSVAIKLSPESRHHSIVPKSGARLSDGDGFRLTDGDVLITPFTLRAQVGGDTVEVAVPELRVEHLYWVADPLGCEDNDPKTRCHPTWGAEYSGEVAGDVPVRVEYADGGIGYSDYGVVGLRVVVTIIDERIRSIEGTLQITYSSPTPLPNYRIPLSGRLR